MTRRRTSVSRSLDTGRAGQALARPGMDTRNWCLQGVITGFKLDDEQGPLADVELLPDGDPETVRLGSAYAGEGFGFYAPLDVGDLVLISFPNGDYDASGVITARLYGPAEPPPQTAKDNPSDVCLHVKKDRTCRIKVFGQGNVAITCEDPGKVLLGDESGTQPVACKTHKVNIGQWSVTVGSGAVTAVNYQAPGALLPQALPVGPITPLTPSLEGEIKEGSPKVEATP